jgi:hypothetical protein
MTSVTTDFYLQPALSLLNLLNMLLVVANMQYRTAFPRTSVVLSVDLLTAIQPLHEACIFDGAFACFLQRLLFKSRKDRYVKEADG